jgi:preprotein translocase subunit SecB
MDANEEKKRIETDIKPVPVQVVAQYVKDFSFENPSAPASLRPHDAKPQMDMNLLLDAVKIEDETLPNLYEASLTLKVKSLREGKPLFIAEIVYCALVSFGELPGQHIKSILYVDVPQMLFPFARQMLANAVTAGGFPPLLLNPIDFRGMYDSKMKESAAA